MKKVFFAFYLLFTLLTFVGAGYVLSTHGAANAGFACVPMLCAVIFMQAYRAAKQSQKPK